MSGRHSRRLLAIATLVLLSHSQVARAQTAEETVVFLLLGYSDGEDGRSLVETTKSSWEIRKDRAIEVKIDIAKIDDCRFTLKLRDAAGKLLVIKSVDFARWRDTKLEWSSVLRGYVLTLIGAQEKRRFVESGNEVTIEHISEVFTGETAFRAQRAASYFRANFCKGRAF